MASSLQVSIPRNYPIHFMANNIIQYWVEFSLTRLTDTCSSHRINFYPALVGWGSTCSEYTASPPQPINTEQWNCSTPTRQHCEVVTGRATELFFIWNREKHQPQILTPHKLLEQQLPNHPQNHSSLGRNNSVPRLGGPLSNYSPKCSPKANAL